MPNGPNISLDSDTGNILVRMAPASRKPNSSLGMTSHALYAISTQCLFVPSIALSRPSAAKGELELPDHWHWMVVFFKAALSAA